MQNSTIADSLSPAELASLEQAFRLEAYNAIDYVDEIETLGNYVTGEYLWHNMWLFGIVLDDDKLDRLGWSWAKDGVLNSGYYVPDDFDTEYQLIELAGPNRHDALHRNPVEVQLC